MYPYVPTARQHDCPFTVMQLPVEPPHNSSLAFTAPLVGCRGSALSGPGAGPERPRPQGMLGHTLQPQRPGLVVVALLPSPAYDSDVKVLLTEVEASGMFSM